MAGIDVILSLSLSLSLSLFELRGGKDGPWTSLLYRRGLSICTGVQIWCGLVLQYNYENVPGTSMVVPTIKENNIYSVEDLKPLVSGLSHAFCSTLKWEDECAQYSTNNTGH